MYECKKKQHIVGPQNFQWRAPCAVCHDDILQSVQYNGMKFLFVGYLAEYVFTKNCRTNKGIQNSF